MRYKYKGSLIAGTGMLEDEQDHIKKTKNSSQQDVVPTGQIQASKVIRVIMSFTDYNTSNFLNDFIEDFYFWEDRVDICPNPSTKYNKAPGHST